MTRSHAFFHFEFCLAAFTSASLLFGLNRVINLALVLRHSIENHSNDNKNNNADNLNNNNNNNNNSSSNFFYNKNNNNLLKVQIITYKIKKAKRTLEY